MIYLYNSLFADRIRSFVAQKNALGYPYLESMRLLYNFDRFCMEAFPDEACLTRELCEAWADRKDSEGNNTFRNRLMPVREFARYLNRTGEEAYVLPPDYAKKGPKHTPHIYTEEEILLLWAEADRIAPRNNFPIRHLVIPVFLRILYCCGLRPIEARRLRRQEVDLVTGRLNIAESKGHKSRIVMMADDVAQMCRNFDAAADALMPDRYLFFPNSDGEMYTKRWIEKTFSILKRKAGISTVGECTPRLYDFRHTFATHRLYKWMQEGKDLSAMIPKLSAYMGHAQLSDTYYYIHFVPGLLEHMTGLDFSDSENLLPEVSTDE